MGVAVLIDEFLYFYYEEYFFIKSKNAITCQENRRFFCDILKN